MIYISTLLSSVVSLIECTDELCYSDFYLFMYVLFVLFVFSLMISFVVVQ